jgi:hypothetical protein
VLGCEYREGRVEERVGNFTYYSSESFREKNDDYHLKVSIPKKTLLLAISREFDVVY